MAASGVASASRCASPGPQVAEDACPAPTCDAEAHGRPRCRAPRPACSTEGWQGVATLTPTSPLGLQGVLSHSGSPSPASHAMSSAGWRR